MAKHQLQCNYGIFVPLDRPFSPPVATLAEVPSISRWLSTFYTAQHQLPVYPAYAENSRGNQKASDDLLALVYQQQSSSYYSEQAHHHSQYHTKKQETFHHQCSQCQLIHL